MKTKLLILIGLLAAFVAAAQEPPPQPPSGIWSTIESWLSANPTNTFDVTGFGVNNRTTETFGAGLRVGYAIAPSLVAALEVSYCDSSWTFASLGIVGRATIPIGTIGSITPYASAGPGWNIRGQDQTIVAVVGAGASVHIKKLPWVDLMGEWEKITGPESQNRVIFGLTRRF